MKVGYLSVDWSNIRGPDDKPSPGGACHYRIALPAKALSEHIDVVVAPNCAVDKRSGELSLQDWDGEMHDGFDIVVMQRWMDFLAPNVIRHARACGQVIINDVDDWYDGLDTSNAAWIASHPRYNERSNRDHYRKVLAASNGLTVSTPYLAERYRRINANIAVVRNAIDLDRLTPRDPSVGPMVVGWTGGTAHRSRDLETIGHVGQWLADHDVEFFHGGSNPRDPEIAARLLGMPENAFTSNLPMQPIHRCDDFYRYFNVGLVPLSDQPFNHAKSAIKGMEYAAAGLPFVAARMPEYEWLSRLGAGQTAKRAKDWTKFLERMLDPVERAESGARNFAAVQQLDMKLRWTDWLDAYEQIVTASATGRIAQSTS